VAGFELCNHLDSPPHLKIPPSKCDNDHRAGLRRDLYFPLISAKLKYNQQKGSPMLATALAIQEATQDAVHDEQIMDMARAIYLSRNEVSEDEYLRMIYLYSASLSALTATLVTSVTLTESQLDEMMSSIKEFDQLGKDITNGNE
jgi:hypothetical protein